ncbi:MAG: GlsB/YeaQ/YmgE family stress response membrane protein [Aggregatilineales bacterium]
MGGLIILAIVVILLLVGVSAALNILFSLIIPLLMAGIVGWLAGMLLRGRGYGILGNVVLGVAGGFVGGILFSLLGIGGGGLIGYIISAVLGALVVLFIVSLFTERRSPVR